MMTRRDPWVNMLRTTVACFAAGVGGADAVTVLPFDAALGLPTTFARRIARNTQSLLVEESHLARVVDPAGGSWYVETLTDELARSAWAWFQEIERAGGLGAALRSGLVADELAATAALRAERTRPPRGPRHRRQRVPAHRREAVAAQGCPAAADRPGGPAAWCAVRRRSRPCATGPPRSPSAPAARRACSWPPSGPLRRHAARAAFAGNLFQAGGIEVDPGEGGSARGGRRGVPRERRHRRLPVLQRRGLRRAGRRGRRRAQGGRARPGWRWPGHPVTREAAYRQAGVDAFLFGGCDAVDVLGRTLDGLGVPA